MISICHPKATFFLEPLEPLIALNWHRGNIKSFVRIQSFWKFVSTLRYQWNQSTFPTAQSSYRAEDAETYDASDSQDIPVPDVYLETVELHGRLFQKHALHHKIYFGPVDEVNAS